MAQNYLVAVKSQTKDYAIVKGYGVMFGGRDLVGDTFTKDTNYLMDLVPNKPVLLEHTLKGTEYPLGEIINYGIDEIGLWVEAKLDKSLQVVQDILAKINKGLVGWSSGSVGHLVRRIKNVITQWPIVEMSLTLSPAEPRTLGIQQIKSFNAELANVLEVEQENRIGQQANGGQKLSDTQNTKGKFTMDETVNDIADKVQAELKNRVEAELAREKEIEARVATEVKRKLDEERNVSRKTRGLHNVAEFGDDNDGLKAFYHYMRTGDEIPVKTAMTEGTAGLGGVTVPTVFYNQIQEKVREQSIMRLLGATRIQVSGRQVDIPVIATGTSSAVYTAEAGGFDQQEPLFDKVTITLYKATNLMKISNELLADTQANLEDVLVNQIASAFADTENTWFFSGNGTNQAYGITTRSGLGVTCASTGTVSAAELNTLVFSLPAQYANRAALVMRRSTLGTLLAITGNPFLFQQTPAGSGNVPGGPLGYTLLQLPVGQVSSMEAMTTGKKPIIVADFSRYFIAENGGLVITRNPYLYMANGQTGIFSEKRIGGDVVQAEAFKHALLA